MGIAEFIIGRAFARPVGSTHPTRWKIERRNCYKGFGSFGLTKPPTTPVGVMRPVTPHSRQGCRQKLAVVHDGLSPSAKPIILRKLQLMGIASLRPSYGLSRRCDPPICHNRSADHAADRPP